VQIPGGFRYVFVEPGDGQGEWVAGTPAPVDLGEVACGVIQGVLYVIGEGNGGTLAYDMASQTWITGLAPRLNPGDHHAAEVWDGKLYVFGGIGSSSAGKVQIYDPFQDQWSYGADMPFAAGSCSSALIDDKVYVAGGIILGNTTTQAAVYDPDLDSWTSIASMPLGRNHAASGTDGTKFYVFGGRDQGNTVLEGYDDVQIYDPQTDTWESSSDPGSTIPVLPQRRGGMGKAAFFLGEFYVIGGETTPEGMGAVEGDVYERVDVYDPVNETWRLEATLPTARHGIFPVVHGNRIYVACGGVMAGNSQSDVLEVFSK
jgi:N-acetylneuraminic acid mutarotase